MNIDPQKDSQMHNYQSTMADISNEWLSEGYKEQFTMTEEGLKASGDKKVYQPDQIKIIKHYRFEGTSDPADMSILYAIETDDGHKGLLSDAYGPYSDERLGEFLKEVEELENQNHPK